MAMDTPMSITIMSITTMSTIMSITTIIIITRVA